MHSRGKKDGSARHEQGSGQEIVGVASGSFCQQIGCCRGHDDQVSLVANPDVINRVNRVKDFICCWTAAEGFPGGYTHEAFRCFRGDDCDLVAGLRKEAQQQGGLVGGNTATYPQNNVQHSHP